MSRAKRIVKSQFWINNFRYLFIILTLASFTEGWGLWGVVFALLVVIEGFITPQYLKKKFHLKDPSEGSTFFSTSSLYFVSDERDKQIALKVHDNISRMYVVFLESFMLLLFFLYLFSALTHPVLSITNVYLILTIWAGLSLIVPNLRYFVLWNRYDQQ